MTRFLTFFNHPFPPFSLRVTDVTKEQLYHTQETITLLIALMKLSYAYWITRPVREHLSVLL